MRSCGGDDGGGEVVFSLYLRSNHQTSEKLINVLFIPSVAATAHFSTTFDANAS